MDEMTEAIGKALQELNSRTVAGTYVAGQMVIPHPNMVQLPQEIVDFINQRRDERERQRNISVGVYGCKPSRYRM